MECAWPQADLGGGNAWSQAAHEDEVALADRILAQHYIMERPDLQR